MNFFFFDLDGTLEDSRDDMANAVNAVREKLELPLRDTKDLKKYVNKGMHELYENCFDDYLSDNMNYKLKYENLKNYYEQYYFENICILSKCYDEIPNTLKELSKENKVFVITNKPEKHSRELLKKLDLAKYITDVMGGDSCSEMKPSPMPLKIVAEQHGFSFSKNKAFMIGDSAGDIQAGHAFQATTVWCSWGYNSEPGSLAPQITVNSPKDLLILI
ncbi:HAD family hydrolase [Silvanigrella aquatica]|uniref:phosphoglycolate phosphatase n=1 Tax=Silvanigrella aquatica TaxID=1915309 RepID=A0A1L4D459_9BACT|nr:HAD-IA family hydrolase [Silvanigrella aquatica]APJ04962.1 hypothetical protein AXG55_14100 [Silvanigrella aquatica]